MADCRITSASAPTPRITAPCRSGADTPAGRLGRVRPVGHVFTYKIVDGVEVHGRCHHPFVGGDGGFAGVSGVLQMLDLPNGCALYKGHLSF